MSKGTQNKTAIYLHIPKTAGSTLGQIIDRNYSGDAILRGSTVGPDGLEQFKENLAAIDTDKLRMLWGHMRFGVHEHLSNNATYFTFMREPIERSISHYYYIKSRPHEFAIATYILENNISFHEALARHLILDIRNVQTRMLAGLPYAFPRDDYTQAHLTLAKHHLDKQIALIGLVEHFDESLLLLQNLFSWRHTAYVRRNTTPIRPLQSELSPETITLLERENNLDIELYAYAKVRFAQQIADQGQQFARQLQRFQFQNRYLSPAYLHSRNALAAIYLKTRKFSIRQALKEQFTNN